jgi:hypothetical protein
MSGTEKVIKFILIGILAIILIHVLFFKENFQRFGGPSLENACEFNEECLFDNSRTIEMSNGMEGVCTTHGLACPSFMLSQNQYLGNNNPLSPAQYKELVSSFL